MHSQRCGCHPEPWKKRATNIRGSGPALRANFSGLSRGGAEPACACSPRCPSWRGALAAVAGDVTFPGEPVGRTHPSPRRSSCVRPSTPALCSLPGPAPEWDERSPASSPTALARWCSWTRPGELLEPLQAELHARNPTLGVMLLHCDISRPGEVGDMLVGAVPALHHRGCAGERRHRRRARPLRGAALGQRRADADRQRGGAHAPHPQAARGPC